MLTSKTLIYVSHDQIKSFKHLIKLYLNFIQKLYIYIYMNGPKLYICLKYRSQNDKFKVLKWDMSN